MLLSGANLRAVSTGYQTVFNKALDQLLKEPSAHQRVATVINTNRAFEEYHWLGDVPAMAAWSGETVFKDVRAESYDLTCVRYSAGIEVNKDTIQDDNLGIVEPRIKGMAQAAASWFNDLVFSQLTLANSALCYDGQALASTAHPNGPAGANQSNKGTGALTQTTFDAGWQAMAILRSEEDRPLNIQPDLLVVGPKLRVTALEIAKANLRETGSAGAAIDNVNKGLVDVYVCPYLVGTYDDYWFLMDTKKAVKPLILQVRESPKFVAQDQLSDEHVFVRNMLRYKVEGRAVAGYGLWQTVYCGIV
jgi:phage major head subunit gpT-like protein